MPKRKNDRHIRFLCMIFVNFANKHRSFTATAPQQQSHTTLSDELDNKAIKGTAWAAIDRLGNMAVQFVVNMILAWLVSPADFACVAILGIFISVSATLLDSGFGSSLIQDKEPTQTDFSTIFYWNIGLSILLCLILFTTAPAVEHWFGITPLGGVLRATSLVLVFNALSLVQTVRLRRMFRFRTLAISDLTAAVMAGILAVVTAYNGAGVWSLVILTVSTAAFRASALWVLSKWTPSPAFSWKSLRRLFTFGGYMATAAILQDVANNIQGVIIGRLAPVQMGYYNQAQKLDQVTSYHLPNILVQVLFPYYSKIRENQGRLADTLASNVRLISFTVVMLLGILILTAEPIIGTLYGAKWLPAVPYFRIFCVGGVFMCIQNVNFYAVASMGRSRELFLWSFYKWGMLLGLVMFGSIWGITGILWGMVVSNLNIYLVNTFLASRFVGLKMSSQLSAVLPGMAVGLLAMAAVCGTGFLHGLNPWIDALLFIALYIGLGRLFRLRALIDISHMTAHAISKLTNKHES